MLVVIFIAGIATTSVMAMLVGSMDGWTRGTSNDYAQTSVSIGLQKLSQEIREAETASVASGRLTVVMPLKTTGANGEVFYNRGTAGESRTYYVANGELRRSVGGVVSVVLKRISAATFLTNGPNVNITLTSNEREGTAEARRTLEDQTATVRVRLRNYGS